ncbi:MAG: hypothetical protein K5855_08645 [Oscillospiraceae bacterium]|nr:hypothetical protein [Oscillospiraceae bacterium]
MKHRAKQLIAIILTLALALSMLPMQAFASLADNSTQYNREILDAIKAVAASEDENKARLYYDVLQNYGLLDEDGNIVESWKIYRWSNHSDITLAELRDILESGDYDPEEWISLEEANQDPSSFGASSYSIIQLKDVKIMLEIEDYLAYIRDTYYSDDGVFEWSQEQQAAFSSLLYQVYTKGITLRRPGASSAGLRAADDVSHGAGLRFRQLHNGQFRVDLTGAAPNQKVYFLWKISGINCYMEIGNSHPGMVTGSIELTADENGAATATFGTEDGTEVFPRSGPGTKNCCLLLNLYQVVNALFVDESEKSCDAMSILFKWDDYSGSDTPEDLTSEKFVLGSSYETPSGSMQKGWTLPGDGTQLKRALELVEQGYYSHARLLVSASTGRMDAWNHSLYYHNRNKRGIPLYPTSGSVKITPKIHLSVLENGETEYYDALFPSDTFDILTGGPAENNAVFDNALILHDYQSGQDYTEFSGQFYTSYFDAGMILNAFHTLEAVDPASEQFQDASALIKAVDLESNGGSTNANYHGSWSMGNASIVFDSHTAPEAVEYAAFAGEYYPGMGVPIYVRFSEPVKAAKTSITVNGQHIPAIYAAGDSAVQTFIYPVQEVDSTFVTITGYHTEDLFGNVADSFNNERFEAQDFEAVHINSPVKGHTFTGVHATLGRKSTNAYTLNVTADISSDPRMTQWLLSEFETDDQAGTAQCRCLGFSVYIPGAGHGFTGHQLYLIKDLEGGIEGAVTGGRLMTAITIYDDQLPDISEPLECVVALNLMTFDDEGDYVGSTPLMGMADSFTLYPMRYIQAENMSIRLVIDYPDPDLEDFDEIMVSDGSPYARSIPVDISAGPTIRAYPVLDRGDYTFGDTTNCTAWGNNEGASQCPNFVWAIMEGGVAGLTSTCSCASIDKDGYITPTGTGSIFPFLQASNDWTPEHSCSVGGFFVLVFSEGHNPYLAIPNASRGTEVPAGTSVPVYWNSNLYEFGVTSFHVSLIPKGETSTVWETDVQGKGVTIPSDYLLYWYGGPISNDYIVRVSAEYAGKEFTASMPLTVKSQPAQVSFGKLRSYYLTDTSESVEIPWTVTDFDRYSADETLFEMQIMCGNSEVASVTDPGTHLGEGSYTGSYTLQLSDFSADILDPTSYRQVYTVTIRAKNGTDSTWSYDSFLLYVYDEDALKILVDGEDISELTMSNIPEISQMTSAEILALKRDISLHNVISANYGEYDWAELADRLAWSSSDNSVATVNYQQGDIYEDIRNFNYSYYRPTSDFVLSGLGNGTTQITATHALTGIQDTLDVTVNTLKDKLYLFSFEPKEETTLTYVNGNSEQITVSTDANGALALYEESGINSAVYCQAEVDGKTYYGTIKAEQLLSGERDSTKLELYPCNYMTLRPAAFAYVYLKNPDGTPYTGEIDFRGGVYLQGVYQPGAAFALNSDSNPTELGSADQRITMGANGKLTVSMDQTQWNEGVTVGAYSGVRYVFCISKPGDSYYPILIDMDAGVNQQNFVSSGSAIVNFRRNPTGDKHPFLMEQHISADGAQNDVLGKTIRVGPNENTPEYTLTSVVLWWGEEAAQNARNRLQLCTADGQEVADDPRYSSNVSYAYPFIDQEVTTYTVELSDESLDGVIGSGEIAGTVLEFYRDGENLSRREELNLSICNLTGVGSIVDSQKLQDELADFGNAMSTSGQNGMSTGDQFVNAILRLIARDDFTEGDEKLFEVKIVPTSDPTRFLGFMQANYGDRIEDAGDTGFSYLEQDDLEYGEDLALLDRIQMAKQSPSEWGADKMSEMNSAKRNQGGGSDWSVSVGGYMEVVIYYDFDGGEWTMQPISGGFHLGGGLEYSQVWNYMAGPIPFTTELTAGGNVEVSMDAITAAYKKDADSTKTDVATEYLTQLRVYLYLRLFAGIGFDYSVIAFKLGIFGMISFDMQFAWLNRPYLEDNPDAYLMATGTDESGQPNPPEQNTENANLSGQHLRINGQIGLELIIKMLFFELDWVLLSYSFDLYNESFNSYDSIQDHWENNQKNLNRAIEALLSNGDAKLMRAGGQTLAAVSMAPTLESRDYLENGDREWGFTPRRGPANPINNLESNTYPYANPELTRDGQIMVYLTDQQSADITKTRAAFATSGWPTYEQGGLIDDGGFGDSELAVDGTARFAAAAWARQTIDLKKEAGSLLGNDEKALVMNGTEIYASIYTDGAWETVRLTDNGGPDVAPTVAVSGNQAIVAWRSVLSGNMDSLTEFDQKDVILCKVYQNHQWSDTVTLYNGTSGSVKGLTSAMMSNGTAAVAYTLDTDSNDGTYTDREIVYAVVDRSGEVIRNVRATNNDKLDENPQLAAVVFPRDGKQHFLLGWYTQNLSTGGAAANSDSDIGLLDFDAEGIATMLIPESMSKVAAAPGVSVSSNFRFTKNAESITDLSLVWTERDSGDQSGGTESVDRDVLKGVKFYLYGGNDSIGFTGALRVAEMSDATLIDHFDVYTIDGTSLKAVVLGTTYGRNGVVEKTGQTVGGSTVTYSVPSAEYAMYTAEDTYDNSFDVPTLAVDYDAVRLGADTLVGLSVRNDGIEPISDVTVDIGGHTASFNGIEILPGYTAELWTDYTVPADGVEDPDYSVIVVTDSDGDGSGDVVLPEISGTVMMDLPDLQITDASILEEVNGMRTIQIKLNNRQDSVLEGSGRSVKLSFWNDATYETRIEDLADVIISSDADLKLIDEGGYSRQVIFDVASYLRGDGEEVVEITDGGVPVYIKAEVIQTVEEETVTVPEPIRSNNFAVVTCDNIRLRTGRDVLINSDVAADNGSTVVTVHLQNTRLTGTATGNLIVSLLDSDGKLIEQKQSYDEALENNGLITLGGEAKKDVTVTFDNVGATVEVVYSDKQIEENDAALSSLSISGIPAISMDIFTDDGSGTFAAEISADDLSGAANITATAANTLSKVSVTVQTADSSRSFGGTSYRTAATAAMTPGLDTTVVIRVRNTTAAVGKTEADYVLTIHNNGAPSIETPAFVINNDGTATLTTAASPQPAEPGYDISYHWYACDETGENITEIAVCTGADTNTVTVTDEFGSEPKYYICEVIRTWLDGSTQRERYFSEPCAVAYGMLVRITANDLTKVYGESDPSAAYSWRGWYNYMEVPHRVREQYLESHLSFTREEGNDVGTYVITPVLDTDERTWVDDANDGWGDGKDYYFLLIPGTLTIEQAPVTVKADNKSKYRGDADPELTATVTGMKYFEDPDEKLSYTLSRQSGEQPGNYTITATGEADQGNYRVTYENGTLSIADAHEHDGVVFLPWTETDSLPPNGGNWFLVSDVTTDSSWYVNDDTSLCLNGHTVRDTGLQTFIDVREGAELNIYDETGLGSVIGAEYGGGNGKDAVICVRGNAVLNLYGGSVSIDDGCRMHRGIIFVKDAAFNMYGGTVSGAEGTNGCGVMLGYIDCDGIDGGDSEGTFNMYGGAIENNVLSAVLTDELISGAGVNAEKGTFTMSGGAIRNNTVQGSEYYSAGGGVFVNDGSSFVISGGVIENNTASAAGGGAASGGGVYSCGAMTVYGGCIAGNTGGDIVLLEGSVITSEGTPDESCSIGIDGWDNSEDRIVRVGGVFTEGLSGAAGRFYSSDDDLIVTTAANGEAQLVPKSSVTVYTVTFLDEDGGELAQADTAENEIPVYPGRTPAKASTNEAMYSFAGWSPEPAPAGGNTSYTAVFDEHMKPAFKLQSLRLSGEIGVNFYLDLSGLTEDQRELSYMTFTVGTSEEEFRADYDPTFLNSSGKYYGFTCFVNAVQMADEITAVYHYSAGGTEYTRTKTYSVEQYINARISNPEVSEDELALIKAIKDYGHYSQLYLSGLRGWKLGEKYALLADPYTGSYDTDAIKTAVQQYEISKTLVTEDIEKVTFSLALDSNTSIYLYVRMAEGYDGGFYATVGGKATQAELRTDGRYRITIPGISAHKLGDTYVVEITTDNGTSTVGISAMSYVYACLNNPSNTAVNKNCAAAIYSYYDATITFKKSQ